MPAVFILLPTPKIDEFMDSTVDTSYGRLYRRLVAMEYAWEAITLAYLCQDDSTLLMWAFIAVSLLFLGCAAYVVFKFPGFTTYAWKRATSRNWSLWMWIVNIVFLVLVFTTGYLPEYITNTFPMTETIFWISSVCHASVSFRLVALGVGSVSA